MSTKTMNKVVESKVFKSGNSLAIRIPKDFGLVNTDRVYIHKDNKGQLVISTQAPPNKWDKFLQSLQKNSTELQNFELERDERLPEERELF